MKERLIGPFILLIGAVLCFFNHHGIYLSDEYIYADNAWQLTNGSFELSNSAFANRFGFLVPMATLIKFFGTNPYVLTLWTSICFILLLWINYALLKSTDNRIALISTALLALNPTLLYYAADVSHDLAMTTFLSIAILILWQSQRQPNKQFILKSVLFVGCLVMAFLTKMTVVYAAPFVLFVFIFDCIKKQNRLFWLSSVVLGVGFLSTYLFSYYEFTGDAFFRFSGIEGEYNVSEYGYFNKSWKEVLTRITILPFAFLLNVSGMGVMGLFVLFGLWVSRSNQKTPKKAWRARIATLDLANLKHFFSIYLVSLVLIFWFSSTSFASYNPIILADRMWMPLIPPLAILASWLIVREIKTTPSFTTWFKFIILMLAIGLTIVLIGFGEKLPNLWMPLLFVVFIWTISLRSFGWRFLPLSLALLFLIYQVPVISTYKHSTAFYYEKEYIESLDPQEEHILLVDKRFLDMPNAHFGWSIPKNIQLKESIPSNLSISDSTKNHHVIINEFRKRHIVSIRFLIWFTRIKSDEPSVENGFVSIYELENNLSPTPHSH